MTLLLRVTQTKSVYVGAVVFPFNFYCFELLGTTVSNILSILEYVIATAVYGASHL